MSLFRLDNNPLKFHIINIDEEELLALKELIEDQGGQVTDDEECLIKFTSPDGYTKKQYQRAKIYDVAFIVECIKENRIVDPEKYRLGTNSYPGDEFLMCHFLYGSCARVRYGVEKLTSTEDLDGFESARTSNTPNDCFQSMEADAILLNEPSQNFQSFENTLQPIDESAPVVDNVHMELYESLLAGGDATENINDVQEKRPCNLEYELSVKPKLNVITEKARKLAASRKTSDVRENHQHQRSPRTLTKRPIVRQNIKLQRNILFNPKKASNSSKRRNADASEMANTENLQIKEETVDNPSSEDISCHFPIVVIKTNGSPENCTTASSAGTIAGTNWIPTKSSLLKKSLNHEIPNDGVKKLRNTNGASQKNTAESSENVDRLRDIVNNETEIINTSNMANTEKRNEKSEKARSNGTRGNVDCTKARTLQNDRERSNVTVRRLKPLCETVTDDESYISSDSSDSLNESRHRENESHEESRNRYESSVDEIIYDDSDSESVLSDEEPRRSNKRTNYNEAGPSGVDNKRRRSKTHSNRSLNDEQNAISRGRVWRSKLSNRNSDDAKLRTPFTATERKKMLHYLLKKKSISMAKGLVIWKAMIDDGHLTHRTPQSLQNHFRKFILPNIATVGYLSDTQMQQFLNLRAAKREK